MICDNYIIRIFSMAAEFPEMLPEKHLVEFMLFDQGTYVEFLLNIFAQLLNHKNQKLVYST